jgi:hypothetical protein
MANRKHASMDPMQAVRVHAAGNRPRADSGRDQLGKGDHSVLARCH